MDFYNNPNIVTNANCNIDPPSYNAALNPIYTYQNLNHNNKSETNTSHNIDNISTIDNIANIDNLQNTQNNIIQQQQQQQKQQQLNYNDILDMAANKKHRLKNKQNKHTKTKRRVQFGHGSNSASRNSTSNIRTKSNVPKSMKNTDVRGTSFPAFFQKNFSADAPNVTTNSGTVGSPDESRLRTTHRSFYPSVKRMIIIGDIHGDLDALIECLKIGRCISVPEGLVLPTDPNKRTSQIIYNFVNKISWIGGDTYIIQLGDQIDRIRPTDWDDNQVAKGEALWDEGSSIHIFYLLWHLNYLANSSGGRVISIMGNHEFMNMDGDFRYVSPGEYKEYYDAFSLFYKTRPPEYLADANSEIHKEINNLQLTHPVPNGYLERRLSYAPGGIMSNFMALHYKVLVQVGSWVFSHAGLTRKTAMSGSIAVINNAISRCLLGPRVVKAVDKRVYEQIVNCRGDDSPIWTRKYGNANLCNNSVENNSRVSSLDALFNDYNKTNQRYLEKHQVPKASKMAVGHTPQSAKLGGINSGLDGRVWRCDVGMSRAFGEGSNNRLQVLEVLDDGVEINVLQNN